MKAVFCSPGGDTIFQDLGLGLRETHSLLRVVGAKAVRDRYSFAAFDSSDRMLGFAVNQDLSTALAYSAEDCGEDLHSFFAFRELLLSRAGLTTPLPFAHFHLSYLGVVPEFRRQGFAKELVRHSLELAKQFQFADMLVEGPDASAQSLFFTLGFQTILSMSYDTLSSLNHRKAALGQSCNLMQLTLKS